MTYLIFILIIPIALSSLVRCRLHIKTSQFFSQRELKPITQLPGISIIIPVRGLDQGAESNYISYVQQEYPSSFEVIFALEEDSDPAVPLIKKLIATYPNENIRLVISDESPGTGKIKNQIAAARLCQYDLWVLIDSDVSISSDFLRSQAAWLSHYPEVGLAYAPPIGVGSNDWVAALHNIGVSASLLNYCNAAMNDNLSLAVGSCMVTRRDVINAIGGLETISHQVVGLDISLGQAVNNANYKIELLTQPARIRHERDTFERYWWQNHRWMTTINHYYPGFWFIGLLIGIPIIWALIFTAVSFLIGQYESLGIILIIYTIAIEIMSAGIINVTISKDEKLWKYIWLAPVGQLVAFPLILLSRVSNRVKWRKRWLSIQTGEIIQ